MLEHLLWRARMTVNVHAYDRSTGPVRAHTRSNPGGSGGGSGKGGVAAVAVSLAVVMGVGSPAPPGSTLVERPPSQLVKTKAETKVRKTATNLVRLELRWQRRGYRLTTHAEPAFDCAAHSYGQVHDFFVAHDCQYMLRAYGIFRDRRRTVALAAFSLVPGAPSTTVTMHSPPGGHKN